MSLVGFSVLLRVRPPCRAVRRTARRLLRSAVRFERLNLNDERYAVAGPFDAIFCRNVLISFDRESKERVLRRLFGHLSPQGYFFLGHSESLTGVPIAARCVQPAVYVPQPPTER